MRRAHQVDPNQADIVRALRRVPGVTVYVTSHVGGGFPDLLVRTSIRHRDGSVVTMGLEVKDGRKVPSDRKLTDAERDFAQLFPEFVHVVLSVDDALRVVGAIR